MAPKKNNNNNRQAVRDGLRTKVREEVMIGSAGGPGSNVVNLTVPPSSSSSSVSMPLNPAGLGCATYASGGFVNTSGPNVDYPHLRKLNTLAADFRYYRVLSGKLIFTPNVGSTSAGQVVLSSSRDVSDSGISAQIAYASGPNYRVFNLSGVGREISIPLDIDTAWKKVSYVLTCSGGTSPYLGAGPVSALIPVNSVADLCFTSIAVTVNNAPLQSGASLYGYVTVEYELELKGLIDSTVNI